MTISPTTTEHVDAEVEAINDGIEDIRKFRLIALDLDGTTLAANHQLSQRTINIIRSLVEFDNEHNGGRLKILLASGRPHVSIVPHAKALQLENDFILSFNGSMLQQTINGPIILHRTVERKWVQEVIDWCEQHNHHVNLYPEGIWTVREESQWTRLYASRSGLTPVVRSDAFDYMRSYEGGSTKLLIIDTPETIQRLAQYWKDRVGTGESAPLYITVTNKEYLEIMPKGVSKGDSLKVLQQQWGISREEIIAFGDALNDLPLLAVAGKSFAMANAEEALKQAADFIAPHHYEDGVARMIEKWLRKTKALISQQQQ